MIWSILSYWRRLLYQGDPNPNLVQLWDGRGNYLVDESNNYLTLT